MLKRAQTHMAVFRANKLYHIEREMEPESVVWLGNTCVKCEVDVPKESWCVPCFLSYNQRRITRELEKQSHSSKASRLGQYPSRLVIARC